MSATVTIPGIVSVLERFLRPAMATSGDGVEVRQDAHGLTVSVCEGRHAATITTKEPGRLDPMLIAPEAFAQMDATKPFKLYRLTDKTGVILHSDGSLVDVAIRPGTLSRSAMDMAELVEGEIASGMTKAVFDVDVHHLLAVAEALVAIGCERVTIASAPRWNTLACIASTDEVSAVFMVAGEEASPDAVVVGDEDGPLSFTIEGRKPRAPSRPRKRKGFDISGISESEIPW